MNADGSSTGWMMSTEELGIQNCGGCAKETARRLEGSILKKPKADIVEDAWRKISLHTLPISILGTAR